ncbi:hypothetical protein WR25_01936 [Diploscapter pachys]|uniref:Uncharacterized protein n=1 Tax=Diploscapter pachys TaxID=2018661 RepID=A0A2A2M5K6_9BILA|nr:hypothetical protein WR25_01936 [Diploscapter pachys]
MRTMATQPRIAPSTMPVGISRRATFHQSRRRSSRSARLRISNEVACEPELPPELMISGMNRVNTTARASSSS